MATRLDHGADELFEVHDINSVVKAGWSTVDRFLLLAN
jgi:hypothetical protein